MWTMFLFGMVVGVNLASLVLSIKESYDSNKKKRRLDFESK